jgi:poly-gamma-glutamate synthesis protein (capsule biosynthesis protein)
MGVEGSSGRAAQVLALAAWSRFPNVRQSALHRIKDWATDFEPASSSLRVVFGGDVMFDPVRRAMWNLGLHRLDFETPGRTLAKRVRRGLTRRVLQRVLSPDYYSPEGLVPFPEFSVGTPERSDAIQLDEFSSRVEPLDVCWSTAATDFDFPFRGIAPFFNGKDLVVLNLETPLSRHERDNGLFKSDPGYARAIRAAGVSLVNLSNNHIFDAGETGFTDTLRHLDEAGVPYCGVGKNRKLCRAGTQLEVRGVRLLFLSYTQFCNSRFASLANSCSGLLPLDRQLMVEDVHAGRRKADFVIVSVHWGFENQPTVHPTQVEIAHRLIDAGADAVIGHHPHVPHGIEIYRKRPIVYSLGNFIFAQRCHPSWSDNFLAELVIDQRGLSGVIVHPVSGRGGSLFQPSLLREASAAELLQRLQLLSLPFNTGIAVRDERGYIGIG